MLICPNPNYRRGPKNQEGSEEKAKLRGRYKKLDSLPIVLALGRRGPKILVMLVFLGAIAAVGVMNERLISSAAARTQSLIAFASNRASGTAQTKTNSQSKTKTKVARTSKRTH